jgi:hypothetical protein
VAMMPQRRVGGEEVPLGRAMVWIEEKLGELGEMGISRKESEKLKNSRDDSEANDELRWYATILTAHAVLALWPTCNSPTAAGLQGTRSYRL